MTAKVGLDDLVAAIGAVLVVLGVGLIYVPAALIVMGAGLIALALWRL